MKKLLQFTSTFVFTLLLCFFINPAVPKADTIDALHTADLPAVARMMAVRSSSGVDTGNREYLVTFNANYGTVNGRQLHDYRKSKAYQSPNRSQARLHIQRLVYTIQRRFSDYNKYKVLHGYKCICAMGQL